jgi:ABC-2 type transport system permease protein
MRLRGLVRKEFLQIRRDPSSIMIAFLMPVILLLLFGYGVSLDADHVPIAIVADQPNADTADFTATLENSKYFDTTTLPGMARAEAAMMAGEVKGIVHLRGDFGHNLRSREGAPIQVIVNGVDANTGRIIIGYVQGAWVTWLGQQARARGEALEQPVQLEQRVWFNSELRSRNFIVPGLIAIIMTLIGALLTAMVVAREWERGTMEALMVTPVSMRELLLGKLIPYFVLGMGSMALSVAMALFLFGVPLRGSLLLLAATSALFLLVASVVLAFHSVSLWRGGRRGAALLTALYALMFLMASGEEVSWGQRIIGWESSEFFKENNKQYETNLHNLIVGDVQLTKSLFGPVLTVCILLYLVGLPLIYPRGGRIAALADRMAVPVPWMKHAAIALGASILIAVLDVDRKWEVYELVFSLMVVSIFILPQNPSKTR